MRRLALAALLGGCAALRLDAQRAPRAAPSRADSLLAAGRLSAAEDALYAAVLARPRAPAPRGALGRYLASRGRFRIAEILYWEAVQFGADSGVARRAVAELAPYRVVVVSGPVVSVTLRPSRDPQAIGEFAVRAGSAAGPEFTAQFDPAVSGLVLGRGAATAFGLGRPGAQRGARELWIGERQLREVAARVDTLAAPDEVRIGLDVLWSLRPTVDERSGILTLGRAAEAASINATVEQVPFVLTFPGLSLVPRVGVAPVPLGSPAGRALLRGTRWQIDAAQSTVVIAR